MLMKLSKLFGIIQVACRCANQCKSLSPARIVFLRQKYAQLTYIEQGNYLLSRIVLSQIKRRRKIYQNTPEYSRRQCSVRYNIPVESDLVDVCKRTFMRIFALSNHRLQNLILFVKRGEVQFVSNAGKNTKSQDHRRKYNEETRNEVILHIMKFPREVSHYSRSKTSNEYLSPDLNIARMYAKFKEDNPDTIIHEKYYRTIFRKYFWDLSFHRPRTDTCMTCDRLQLKKKLDPTDLQIIRRQEFHLLQAEKASKTMYKHMRESREPDSKTFVISMDLEKVLFVPTLTHSQMYYSRQLSVYNLCIHSGDTQRSYMCIWHEGIAGRGANEIISCFLKVLLSKVTAKRRIEVFCDNCAGQNKNQMMVFAMLYLVVTRRYKSIECRFLVSGHSFMPCDQDFAVIEKRKKYVPTMVPEEIKTLVRTVKKDKPFKVVGITPDDIFDLRKISHKLLNPAKLNISTVTAVKVTQKSLVNNSVFTKKTYSDTEDWEEVAVAKKRVKLARDIPTYLPTVKNGGVIKKDKLQDLQKMIEFLDPQYREFYETLCQRLNTTT